MKRDGKEIYRKTVGFESENGSNVNTTNRWLTSSSKLESSYDVQNVK